MNIELEVVDRKGQVLSSNEYILLIGEQGWDSETETPRTTGFEK